MDAVVREDVALIKMDVEGFEPHVLDSAKGLFDQHLVDDVRPRPVMLSAFLVCVSQHRVHPFRHCARCRCQVRACLERDLTLSADA